MSSKYTEQLNQASYLVYASMYNNNDNTPFQMSTIQLYIVRTTFV